MRSIASTLFLCLVSLLPISGEPYAFAEDRASVIETRDPQSTIDLTNRITEEIKALRLSGSLPAIIMKWPFHNDCGQ